MAPRYKDISTRTKISSQLRSTQARQGELIGTDIPFQQYENYGALSASVPSGRLTLQSGVPVPVTDQSAKTTVYFTPFNGDTVPIYDGALFGSISFAELSLALDSNTGHTQYHQEFRNFDCFVAIKDGDIFLGTGPRWGSTGSPSDSSRGTGAGTTEITLLGGIYVNAYDIDLRYGNLSGDIETIVANQATYVGTIRIGNLSGGNGTVYDTGSVRGVFNAHNRVPRSIALIDTTNSWTYNSTSWDFWNTSATIQIEVIRGLDIDVLQATCICSAINDSATPRPAAVGIGINDATVNSASILGIGEIINVRTLLAAFYSGCPGLGRTRIMAIQRSSAAGVRTFYGDDGGTNVQSGISGTVWS